MVWKKETFIKSFKEPLLGTVYMVEQNLSLKRMYQDLANIKDHGLNLVVMWPPCSPWDSPDGASLSYKTCDKIMDRCDKLDLKVIVETEGQSPSLQYLPDYMFTPDMAVQSDRNRHWVNFYHPKVIKAMDSFLTKTARHYKGHPALFAYDVYNEVNFHSTDKYTEQAFRVWLKNKYSSVKAVNKIWKRTYKNFSDIYVSNLTDIYSRWASMRPFLDFEAFRADSIQSFVRTWGETIKKVDRDAVIIADNSWSMTTFDTTILANDDWKIAEVVDAFGLSVYPHSWDTRLRENPVATAQIFRGGLSAGKDSRKKAVMISELQTHNQTALSKGSTVYEEIKLWTWQAFAHGAEGLVYWKWNPFTAGFQVAGRGMTAADGKPNSRAAQAKDIAAVLKKNPDLFLNRKVYHHHVYLLYEPECDRLLDFSMPDDKGIYRKSMAWWYEYFWLKGIQPRFIKTEDLNGIKVNKHTMIAAPLLCILGRKAAATLKNIVKKGGHIIADSRFAIIDENTFAYEEAPGGLTKTMGYLERDYLSPYPNGLADTTVTGYKPNEKLGAFERFSKVKLVSSKVFLKTRHGDPLVIQKKQSFYTAVPMGLEKNIQSIQKALDNFVSARLPKEIEIISKDSKIDLTISEGDGLLICAVNFKREKAEFSLKLKKGGELENLWPKSQVSFKKNILKVTIPAREPAGIWIH